MKQAIQDKCFDRFESKQKKHAKEFHNHKGSSVAKLMATLDYLSELQANPVPDPGRTLGKRMSLRILAALQADTVQKKVLDHFVENHIYSYPFSLTLPEVSNPMEM